MSIPLKRYEELREFGFRFVTRLLPIFSSLALGNTCYFLSEEGDKILQFARDYSSNWLLMRVAIVSFQNFPLEYDCTLALLIAKLCVISIFHSLVHCYFKLNCWLITIQNLMHENSKGARTYAEHPPQNA